MRSWMALLALAPACGFSSGPGDEGGPVDAGRMCYGTIVPICFPASAVPTTVRMLVQSQIDTDLTGTGSACDPDNDHHETYCVVAGAGLSLPSGMTLSARGKKPLVLLSTGAMDLAGTIDVGSHQDGMPQLRGAGANPTEAGACSFAMPPMRATMGGGGAGASFGTQGGAGGDQGTPPGGGGRAGSNLDRLPALRGGCPGGDGSVVSTAAAAAGGDGGGAIALVAVLQIRVSATINASGGGGHGGAAGAANGGGGGGSGGMIVFDSSQPLMLGPGVKLWANGGGGGQGSSSAMDGGSGGESGDPMASALGARTAGAGGLGGDGSVGTMPGGKGTNGILDGAGGGGGGGGFIHAPGLTDPAAISPPG